MPVSPCGGNLSVSGELQVPNLASFAYDIITQKVPANVKSRVFNSRSNFTAVGGLSAAAGFGYRYGQKAIEISFFLRNKVLSFLYIS